MNILIGSDETVYSNHSVATPPFSLAAENPSK